jgi:hypothetical protein
MVLEGYYGASDDDSALHTLYHSIDCGVIIGSADSHSNGRRTRYQLSPTGVSLAFFTNAKISSHSPGPGNQITLMKTPMQQILILTDSCCRK